MVCIKLLLLSPTAQARSFSDALPGRGARATREILPRLGRSFLFFRKHQPATEEAFPSDNSSQGTRQKHQLASSTLPFDHDRCCSYLALYLKHYRNLNIAFLPWLRRQSTQHPGLGPRTCPVLGPMTTPTTRKSHNHFRAMPIPRRSNIMRMKRLITLRLDRRHHPQQVLQVNNLANVTTDHAHVASA